MYTAEVLEQEPVPQESIVTASMEQYGTLHLVCSYHFMPVNRSRNFKTEMKGNYTTPYKWAACTSLDARPQTVVVRDGIQKRFVGTDPSSRQKGYVDEPWAAIHIARDLLKSVTGVHETGPEFDGPAFWISKAKSFPRTAAQWATWGTAAFAAAYPEFFAECEGYRARSYRHCERRVAEGDTHYQERKMTDITDLHRRAALLIGANDQEHQWIRVTKMGDKVACPMCGSPTSAAHPKCGTCNEIINPELYERLKAQLAPKPLTMPPPPPLVQPPAPLTPAT